MKLRTCEFCGTEYDASLEKCPLCGKNVDQVQTVDAAPVEKKRRTSGGARLAQKAADEEKVPKGMWIAICSVLGAAVLVGLVFFLYIMGLFGNFSMKPSAGNVQEPDVLPEYNYENQVPETPVEEEPVEEEPEEEPGACTGLSISKREETLTEAGEKFFLTAVAKPMDCTDPIEFASSDESVVTVNINGMVTAIAPGVAEIIVTCGDIVETCTVTCDFAPAEEEEPEEDPEENPEETPEEEPEAQMPPTLNTEDFTLRYPAEKTQLKVNYAPEGAVITYVSGNTAVVTVSNTGEVTAVADGNTTITVTVGDVVLTCIARVNLESSAEDGGTDEFTAPFALTHTDVSLFSVGDSFTLKLLDAEGKTIPVGWFASNGCVTIVGNSMQAAASGTCTVSCVYNGETYSCIIRCNF